MFATRGCSALDIFTPTTYDSSVNTTTPLWWAAVRSLVNCNSVQIIVRPYQACAPFAAVYFDSRQELDFGGYFVLQGGWQIRGGQALHTLRLGAEYVNGKSTQNEFYNNFEQRYGLGVWYDF